MLINLFICGSSTSFEEEEEDKILDEVIAMSLSAGASPCSTPRKSRKKADKNPYSARGLDKFSALLADLEEKRQKIYETSGSQDISFVRFAHKNSNDLVPIVVKLKDKENNNNKDHQEIKSKAKRNTSNINYGDHHYHQVKEKKSTQNSSSDHQLHHVHDKFPIETSAVADVKEVNKQSQGSTELKMAGRSLFSWNNMLKLDRFRRPSYYLPVVVILILIFLAVFGRSVAILCTSIGWYVVPTLKESSSKSKRTQGKKKDYVKKLSGRKMVTTEGEVLSSPRINHNKSPKQHSHQRSW